MKSAVAVGMRACCSSCRSARAAPAAAVAMSATHQELAHAAAAWHTHNVIPSTLCPDGGLFCPDGRSFGAPLPPAGRRWARSPFSDLPFTLPHASCSVALCITVLLGTGHQGGPLRGRSSSCLPRLPPPGDTHTHPGQPGTPAPTSQHSICPRVHARPPALRAPALPGRTTGAAMHTPTPSPHFTVSIPALPSVPYESGTQRAPHVPARLRSWAQQLRVQMQAIASK